MTGSDTPLPAEDLFHFVNSLGTVMRITIYRRLAMARVDDN